MILNYERRVLRHCLIIDRSSSVVFMDDYLKFIAAVKSLSDIEGEKFCTSKFPNDYSDLLVMF